jgi:hypothetical protein
MCALEGQDRQGALLQLTTITGPVGLRVHQIDDALPRLVQLWRYGLEAVSTPKIEATRISYGKGSKWKADVPSSPCAGVGHTAN